MVKSAAHHASRRAGGSDAPSLWVTVLSRSRHKLSAPVNGQHTSNTAVKKGPTLAEAGPIFEQVSGGQDCLLDLGIQSLGFKSVPGRS